MKFVLSLVIMLSAAAATAVSAQEDKVLAELNLARQQPKKYAGFLEQHRKRFVDDKVYKAAGSRIMTQEGRSAVDEAIEFLKKAKPVGALTMSKGLSKAAADHVRDIGKSGATSHDGSDGSAPADRMSRYGEWKQTCGENLSFGPKDAREIVMQLIIDDGVPGRGHRDNIFNSGYRVVGLSVGPHGKYGNMCAMDFAGGFSERAR